MKLILADFTGALDAATLRNAGWVWKDNHSPLVTKPGSKLSVRADVAAALEKKHAGKFTTVSLPKIHR